MSTFTSKDRIAATLAHEKPDRIGVFESFWGDTVKLWRSQGHLGAEENPEDHFDLDLLGHWAFKMVADLDFEDEIISEDAETKVVKNGNGAIMKYWKDKTGTPEHVDFTVKDKAGWNELVRPFLVDKSLYRKRIDFETYRARKEKAASGEKFFTWSGVNVFELMHPVCGHEYMLMGMALEPDWVKDMAEVFSDLTIELMEILFAEEGKPDGLFFYEDMGFKERPFMSPDMYREMIYPAHKKTIDYAHDNGLKVIMHSCGFIEPLLPHMVDAGLDCLQAMEVKAGMDVRRIRENFGDKLALFGGLDIRTLETNDLEKVKAEIDSKVPLVMNEGGYILHSDHSIPQSVSYETYKYFVDYGLKVGTY